MSEYLIKYVRLHAQTISRTQLQPGIEASKHRWPIVAASGNAATAEEFMTGTLTHVLNDRLPRNVAQRVQARVTANVVLAGDCCCPSWCLSRNFRTERNARSYTIQRKLTQRYTGYKEPSSTALSAVLYALKQGFRIKCDQAIGTSSATHGPSQVIGVDRLSVLIEPRTQRID